MICLFVPAAPELLEEKRQYGKEVDIWSLGVLLYTAIATTTPFYLGIFIYFFIVILYTYILTYVYIVDTGAKEGEQEEEQEKTRQQIMRGEFSYDTPIWDSISDEGK